MNRVRKPVGITLGAFAALLLSCTADAAEFCVRTAEELQMALTASQSNGVDDHVRISSDGAIILTPTGVTYDADGVVQTLWIEGGYDFDCQTQSPAHKSIVDLAAVTAPRGVFIDAAFGVVRVTDVAFKNKPDSGGSYENALYISGREGDFSVERSAFYANYGANGSALLLRSENGTVAVRNSVFHNNVTRKWATFIGGGNTAAQAAESCLFEGNTAYQNQRPAGTTDAAIAFFNCNATLVSSSIFTANAGHDLVVQNVSNAIEPQQAVLDANNIEEFSAFLTQITESGSLNIQLDLGVNAFKLFLPAGSPLIDAGSPEAVAPTDLDFLGRPRVAGARRDMGAFETQVTVFANGFE